MKQTCEILMASYNGERFLREQIDSILDQDTPQWHLTISDDGSTDETGHIIQEYAELYPSQITIHQTKKRFGNARDHFFYLTEQCKADYVFYCDQDDLWYSDKVKRLLNTIIAAEQKTGKGTPILAFGDLVPVDVNKQPLAASLMSYQKLYSQVFDYRSILMQNVVTGGSMAVNRALIDLALKCVSKEKTIMHDWWLAAVAARFGQIIFVDHTIGIYRQHDRNMIGAKHVDSLPYIKKSIITINEVKDRIRKKKQQAVIFRETYEMILRQEDFVFLDSFGKQRSGIQFYWRNRKLIHSPIRFLGMIFLG